MSRLNNGLSSASSTIWVVVAAFNEENRITETLRDLSVGTDFQIVVVDDGSTDTTAETIRRFPVWLLQHPVNCGQGAALRTGIEFALGMGAEIVVTFDADGQHHANEIARLVEPVRIGTADVVLGSRFLGRSIGMPILRRWLLRTAVRFTRLIHKLDITDVHNGLRAFNAKAARLIRVDQPRMAHASEILQQISHLGLRYCEVPVTIRYSSETLAKGQSTWDAVRIGGQVLMGRFIA